MVKQNPIIYACLICVFLFYSGLVKVKERNPFVSLLETKNITNLCGKIKTSPVKISSGKYYSVLIEVFNVKSKENYFSSSKGNITAFLPVEMVESLYPGKLYSSARKTGAFLCETGAIVNLNGYVKTSSSNKNCIFYCKTGKSSGFEKSFFGRINYFRALCRLHLKRLMYSWGEAGGLLLALICGAKEYTSPETTTAFKNAGLSHILALSGMHLSLFSGLVVIVGKKMKKHKFIFFAKPFSIILFVWFAGFSPSLLRAFICSSFVILQSMSNVKKSNMITVLCFSFLLQCIISPNDITNAGFLLSYGALAGILLFSQCFDKLFIKLFPPAISSSISASTSAQFFTAPISLKLFGTFCPFGIIASTIVSPLVTIFIYAGLFLILLNLICPIFVNISGIFINFLYTIIKNIVIVFSHLPIINIGEQF